MPFNVAAWLSQSNVAWRRALGTALLASALLSLFAPPAHAESPPAPAGQAEVAQLERELDLHAREGRRERISQGIMGLVLGATLLPAGIVLGKRNDELVHLVSIGTTVTGATQLLKLPGLIFPSDMERMRGDYLKLKQSGLSGSELVRATEKIWQKEARQEHLGRAVIGYFHLGVGMAAIPLGLFFMLRHEVGDMSHTKQLNVGSTLLGIGIPVMGVAAELLFNKGPVERSWQSHEVTRRERLTRIELNVAPVAHGGMLSAGGRF
ncbi:MAG: hypothetical protein QM778_21280 [Myxococcales bacterium]